MLPHLEEWGGPSTFPHYAVGWAWGGDAPFQWTKQVASHFGGTRNGMVVHWPTGIKAKNEVRSQFCHAVDIAPTIMDVAGLPFPKSVNGTEQTPLAECLLLIVSMMLKRLQNITLNISKCLVTGRSIMMAGWPCTRHSTPWVMAKNPPLKDDVWELYNVNEDFSQANNLAAQNPEKLKGVAENI
jgi:arylsulfatase